MSEIKIEVGKDRLIETYKNTDENGKQLLIELYGKLTFCEDLLDKDELDIEDFPLICAKVSRPDVPEFLDVPEDLREHFKDYYRIVISNEWINNKERFNIFNFKKYRYYPYFLCGDSPSGFRFYRSDCAASCTLAGSGSRLCTKSEETAEKSGVKLRKFWLAWLNS